MTILADIARRPKVINVWVREKDLHLSCYMRRGAHAIGDELVECLDLSSVKVDKRHWGRGHLSAFVERFEAFAQKEGRVVYVENVFEPGLIEAFERRGYTVIPPGVFFNGPSRCLWKRP